ncbi:MAG TPA: DUF2182 domain-containing protein [Rhodanobacteraceae bacterium]
MTQGIGMHPVSTSERGFLGAMAILLVASTALTIAWSGAMARMHEMPMPGGWTLSMMWMRMPGQSWPGVAAAFLGMWLVMMTAMMLPSLLPMLRRYRRAVVSAEVARPGALTAIVGAGYLAVWTLFGAVVFAIGAALTSLELALPALARAAPLAAGAIVSIAGVAQLSGWKASRLACCRGDPPCRGPLRADASSAWRHGAALGVQCVACCLTITIAMLVVGMMDLRAMAFATAAISAERLAPRGAHIARLSGAVMVAGGFLLLRAAIA